MDPKNGNLALLFIKILAIGLFSLIDFVGCSVFRSDFKKAMTLDTPEAYIDFLDKYSYTAGAENRAEYIQAKKRLGELFPSSVKSIEIRQLWPILGKEWQNPEQIEKENRIVEPVYEDMKNFIKDELENRGFVITFGKTARFKYYPNKRDYEQLFPMMDRTISRKTDAVMFIELKVQHETSSAHKDEEYTRPYELAGDNLYKGIDITYVRGSYFIWDVWQKKPILKHFFGTRRENNFSYQYEQAKKESNRRKKTVEFRWGYLETEQQFLKRIAKEIASSVPGRDKLDK